ncbi:MAG: hypothetical protein JWO19_5856 [Bryobacterales bacterium]|nr:hypothetical protein [Bryobacterales bacterium]
MNGTREKCGRRNRRRGYWPYTGITQFRELTNVLSAGSRRGFSSGQRPDSEVGHKSQGHTISASPNVRGPFQMRRSVCPALFA